MGNTNIQIQNVENAWCISLMFFNDVLYMFQFTISRENMASLCAACERYIGTQGGGMDQAIAFLATQGTL